MAKENELLWLVVSDDQPGMAQTRKNTRPLHLEHMKSGGGGLVKVVVGSPICDESAGEEMIGTWYIVDGRSRSDVDRFVARDPYQLAGVFRHTEIRAIFSAVDLSGLRGDQSAAVGQDGAH